MTFRIQGPWGWAKTGLEGRSLPGLMAPGCCRATYLVLMPHELGYSLIGTRVDAVSLPITFRRSSRRVWLPIRGNPVAQCQGIDLPDCYESEARPGTKRKEGCCDFPRKYKCFARRVSHLARAINAQGAQTS